jgi:hypothetical protein
VARSLKAATSSKEMPTGKAMSQKPVYPKIFPATRSKASCYPWHLIKMIITIISLIRKYTNDFNIFFGSDAYGTKIYFRNMKRPASALAILQSEVTQAESISRFHTRHPHLCSRIFKNHSACNLTQRPSHCSAAAPATYGFIAEGRMTALKTSPSRKSNLLPRHGNSDETSAPPA